MDEKEQATVNAVIVAMFPLGPGDIVKTKWLGRPQGPWWEFKRPHLFKIVGTHGHQDGCFSMILLDEIVRPEDVEATNGESVATRTLYREARCWAHKSYLTLVERKDSNERESG